MTDAPRTAAADPAPATSDHERRQHRRYDLRAPGLAADMNGVYDCVVGDISLGGVMLEGELPLEVGTEVAIGFDTLMGLVGTVMHHGDGFFGVKFVDDMEQRAKVADWIFRRLKAARREREAAE